MQEKIRAVGKQWFKLARDQRYIGSPAWAFRAKEEFCTEQAAAVFFSQSVGAFAPRGAAALRLSPCRLRRRDANISSDFWFFGQHRAQSVERASQLVALASSEPCAMTSRRCALNWPLKSGRHEVCYFDQVEDV